jgi:fluoroquinolone resistance protein
MSQIFIEDHHFQGLSYSEIALPKGDYENCRFSNCIFANSSLSHINFSDCTFEHCDFSLANVKNTAFKDVIFKNCKSLGVKYEDCNTFGFAVHFESCVLNLSTFYKLSLKNCKFKDCSLEEVDFAETNMISLALDNCNLLGAKFDETLMEKADFRTAYNYTFDPEKNRIKKAKFSMAGIAGLLEKYNIDIQ